jgi:cbb3-type cytochrome oxidase maturation protein
VNGLLLLVPVALALGGAGLLGFFWAMRHEQFDDLDGAARRVLLDEDEED